MSPNPTDLNLLFVQGMLQPEDGRGWEKFLRRQVNYRHRLLFPSEGREYARGYRLKNSEKTKKSVRTWRKENPELVRGCRKDWQKRNPDKVRKNYREREQRRLLDPGYRLKQNLRGRVSRALKGFSKTACTQELLGMGIPEFKIYLQGQFLPGMTWENYGSVWELDHIKPCASFTLSSSVQQHECFNWSNCQPLFAEDNLRKGANF